MKQAVSIKAVSILSFAIPSSKAISFFILVIVSAGTGLILNLDFR